MSLDRDTRLFSCFNPFSISWITIRTLMSPDYYLYFGTNCFHCIVFFIETLPHQVKRNDLILLQLTYLIKTNIITHPNYKIKT